MVKQNYNCTEQELYTICETAWASCLQYLPSFTALKAKYTESYIATQQADILNARNLPDEQQRNANYETASINLKTQGRRCCDKWQLLKRYIADAFPPNQQKPILEAAGYNYYEKAASNNWDSVKGLLTSASTFIAANTAQLTANNNMPPNFQTEFDNEKITFETLHQQFIQAEEEARVGQAAKMNANNALHTQLMSMLLDGQEIFKNNEALLKQFIFAELLYLASGSGTAGIRGQVLQAISNEPLQNVLVTILTTGKTATTDPTGRYEITQVASGNYNITFQLEGYQTATTQNFNIKVGTVSTLNTQLTPNP